MALPMPHTAFAAGAVLRGRTSNRRRARICAQYLPTDGLTIDFSVPTRTGNFGNVFFGRYDAEGLDVVVKCPTDSELGRKLLNMERHTNEKLVQRANGGAGSRFPRYIGQLIVPPGAAVAPGLARYGLAWMLEGAGDTLEDYLSSGRVPSLASVLGTNAGPSPLRRAFAAAVLAELLTLLAELQDAGIVHRDIKPANILVVPNDPSPLKAIDFGSSCDWGSLMKYGLGLATCDPVYTAPERKLELLRPALAFDVYSVGLIGLRCALPSLTEKSGMASFVTNVLAKNKSCIYRVCNAADRGDLDVPSSVRMDLQALNQPANEDLLALLATMLAQTPENRTDVRSALNSRFLAAAAAIR